MILNKDLYLIAITKNREDQICNLCGGSKIDIKVTGVPRNLLSIPKGQESIPVQFYHYNCFRKDYPEYERRLTDIINQI